MNKKTTKKVPISETLRFKILCAMISFVYWYVYQKWVPRGGVDRALALLSEVQRFQSCLQQLGKKLFIRTKVLGLIQDDQSQQGIKSQWYIPKVQFSIVFPRDGTSRDKKKILSCGPVVPGQGQEQMSRAKFLCPGPSRDKTIQNFSKKKDQIYCFRTSFSCFRTSFHVLERPFLF